MLRTIRFTTAVVAAFTTCTFTSCSEEATELVTKTPERSALHPHMLRHLTLDTARTEAVRSEVKLTGRVSTNLDKTVQVYPLVGGVVEAVRVSLGDHVEKGQVLAVIKSGEIADLQNQNSAAGSDLTIARKNLQVTEDLFGSGLAAERDVLTARQELRKAQANAGKSRKQLSVYGVSADGTYTLRAPISGFITEKNVTDRMQFNADNVDNLFTIANLSTVWVLADVFQADIAHVQVGHTADVTTLSYPDKHFIGHIDKVFNMLDPESKVMKVRVRLDNSDYLLKPGMHARVNVSTIEKQRHVAVAHKNLVFHNDRNFVLVFKDPKHIETREVSILKTVGDKSYVSSGLQDGERVVAQNQLLLYKELND
ncbi:efflux RND transporter periplasmic adaptor subunit [Hymenobacter sp. GOD-10R]|uniref:efflux RND transporter periplasmic adaptor subunit n=1 Tax=Hymenobacter sp. GOD-10R TaxID=3093922 RepID=UPI002D76E07E|nr:efflux RND transporter periplasmic adaptor subunit [Hymenobacter sp. GOD-10R]WRQ26751.1 efflux RND transporter periplasmic adaptor subunit [Hymenobacter sp. GOD-10R]